MLSYFNSQEHTQTNDFYAVIKKKQPFLKKDNKL